VIEDLPEDEEEELIKSLDTIKKNFLKKGKAAGYINQEDVMEATSKLDLSDEDFESLDRLFQRQQDQGYLR
jgi:hypothetical protein